MLTYGILSAAVLRGIMIAAGAELLENFQAVLLLFAGVLLFSSWKLLAADDGEEEEDLSDNWIVTTCRCARMRLSHNPPSLFPFLNDTSTAIITATTTTTTTNHPQPLRTITSLLFSCTCNDHSPLVNTAACARFPQGGISCWFL